MSTDTVAEAKPEATDDAPTPIKLPHSVYPVVDVADTESSRYALSAVKLERSNGRARAVATDGRRIMLVEWPDDGPTCGVLIPQEVWRDADHMAEHLSRLRNVEVTPNATVEGESLVSSKSTRATREQRFLPEDGRFPKWEECIPSHEIVAPEDKGDTVRAIEIRFDAKLLGECLFALLQATPKSEKENRTVIMSVPLDCFSAATIRREGKDGVTGTCVIMLKTLEAE